MRNHNHRFRMTVKTHDAADAFSPSPFRIWLPSTQHPIWTFSLLWPPLAFILVCQGTCLHHNNHHFDPHWLVFQVDHDPNIDHLQVCQGTCLCSPSTEGYGKGKVLYCYGEVIYFLNIISKILLSPPFSAFADSRRCVRSSRSSPLWVLLRVAWESLLLTEGWIAQPLWRGLLISK